MVAAEIPPFSKEWVEQMKKDMEEAQAALNKWSKDSFNCRERN